MQAVADHSLGTTTGCVMCVTAAALGMIVYAALTFLGLLSTTAQDVIGLITPH